MFFSEYMPSSRIAGSYGSSLFSFVRTLQLFSTVAIPVYIPTSGVEVLSFLHILSILSIHPSPCGSAGKESACNEGDLGLIPGLGRSPGEGKGYTLQYSGLENSMDCIAQGAAKSRTQLSDFHFHFSLSWQKPTQHCKAIILQSKKKK